MDCTLSERELWSGLDRDAPEVRDHLVHCSQCRRRAAEIEMGMSALADQELSSAKSRPLPERIGAYRVTGYLGEGGMGLVYSGEQEYPDREVAIKVIRGGDQVDETRIRLFQREVQTLARMKHPSIAAIYEAGRTADQQHFFAMELVRGVPPGEYVRDRGISMAGRLELFHRICEPIQHAHQRGVIHRDLKPSNILVDEAGQPKILDFGLARIADPELPTTSTFMEVGKLMGTLPYMSPEEARGDALAVDVRSDVYSLGVILYELITGTLPYVVTCGALHEAVRVICEEVPRKPSLIQRSLRGDLDTIALKALEKQPGRRYESVAALADDIHRHLTDQPILARPPSIPYRFRKLLLRRKGTSIFVALMLLMFGLGGAWMFAFESRTRAQMEFLMHTQELQNAGQLMRTGDILHRFGIYDTAEMNLRQAESMYIRLRGEDDELTARARLNLAALLIERKHGTMLDEARSLLESAMTYYDTTTMPAHQMQRKRGDALRELVAARQLHTRGGLSGAAVRYRRAIDAARAIEAASERPDPRLRAWALFGLSTLRAERGGDDVNGDPETDAVLAEARSLYAGELRTGHAEEVEQLAALEALHSARARERAGDVEEARSAYRAAVADLESAFETHEPYADLAGLGLGRTLLASDRPADWEEASGWIHDALETFEQVLPTGHPARRQALEALRTLYDADHLHDPEALAEVERIITAVDAAASASL